MKQTKSTFLLFFLCLNIFTLAAQTAVLKGIIIDSKNEEPLIGASIMLSPLKNGTTTNNNGEFTLSNLPAGRYEASVSYIGYAPKKETVVLKAGETKSIIIRLKSEAKSLKEVIVTAKSTARKLREQAMPISVINMNQLQGTVSNVQDILSKTMGITIRSSGGVGSKSRISVRGLEGKRIGFFIDGSPMNDNSDFVDINDIPIEMIDRIEIYKGVVPAKFGGSAVGGAVNIVIKEYPPKYIDASYSIESFNTHKFSLVTKHNNASKGLEFGLGGFYTHADNDYKMQSPFNDDLIIKRDHDQFKKMAFGGSFKARKWYFDLAELEIIHLRSKKQIQGIESNIRKAHSRANVLLINNKLEKENFLIDGLDLDWAAYYAYTNYSLIDTASQRVQWDGTILPGVSSEGGEIGLWASNSDNKKHTTENKLNLNYVLTENHSLNFNSLFSFAYGNPKDETKERAIGYKTDFDSHMVSWVAGLTYDFRAGNDRLLNSLSGKFYYYNTKTRKASIASPQPQDFNIKKTDWGVNNAFRYRLIPNLMVKTALGYEVRLPSENELLGDGFLIAPAGNLSPERNASLNVGMLFDLTGKHSTNLQVEVNAFAMYLKNMIRFTGGVLQSQYENFGEMRTLGIEAEIKADITSWLYGYANMTYQDLRDTRKYEQNTSVPNPTKGSRIPNIPYFMANAGFEFHKENLFGGKGQNTRFFIDGSFVEEYLYNFEQSIYQERRIPRTFSSNAGIEHSILNGRIILNARINNLTDTRMLSEFNRPLPGRNFGFRIRYVFK